MRSMALPTLLIVATAVSAAPIPKSLKVKHSQLDFEGYWEQTGSNSNGQVGTVSHGKYWKIEKDKFYYNLGQMEIVQSSNNGPLSTPDDRQPQIKLYNDTRCRLEIVDDDLTWVFANDKSDRLENCDVGPRRVIYYFKRVK